MRWSLSFNVRSHIANKTHEMYGMLPDKSIAKEATSSRSKRDSDDEQAMLDILQRFKVFSNDAPKDTLQNIATKDLEMIKFKSLYLTQAILAKKKCYNLFVIKLQVQLVKKRLLFSMIQ